MNVRTTAVGNRSPDRKLVAGGLPAGQAGGVWMPPSSATSCKKYCCERTNTVHRWLQPHTITKRSTTCNLPQMSHMFPKCSPNEQPTTLRSDNEVLNQQRPRLQQSARHRDVVCQRIGKACELIGQEFVHGDRGRGGRAPIARRYPCWWQRARRELLHKLGGILTLQLTTSEQEHHVAIDRSSKRADNRFSERPSAR